MIDLSPHRQELRDRIDVALRLVDETHQPTPSAISREARGLAVLLLFAAYENLMRSLTQTLLETAVKMRVSNRRLQPGFRLFALADSARSIRDLSQRKLFSQGLPRLVELAASGDRKSTINTKVFPDDGSYMKKSQVALWTSIFDLPNPATILTRTWNSLDAIVTQRNWIAHGQVSPADVGRRYTEAEVRSLIADWIDDWVDFLDAVEARGVSRDFYRLPR